MTRVGRALAGGMRLLPLLPLLFLVGCNDELTQVVLVVQSDLTIPSEVDGMDVTSIEGPFAPPVSPFLSFGGALDAFPRSVGYQSGGVTRSFSVTVRLFRGVSQQTSTPTLIISRTVTDVSFVEGQTMMLLFPLTRACACDGTTCPSPGNPACDNLVAPEVQPFDPAIAPPSTMQGTTGGPIGPPPRPTP